jgi:hypothetical protein
MFARRELASFEGISKSTFDRFFVSALTGSDYGFFHSSFHRIASYSTSFGLLCSQFSTVVKNLRIVDGTSNKMSEKPVSPSRNRNVTRASLPLIALESSARPDMSQSSKFAATSGPPPFHRCSGHSERLISLWAPTTGITYNCTYKTPEPSLELRPSSSRLFPNALDVLQEHVQHGSMCFSPNLLFSCLPQWNLTSPLHPCGAASVKGNLFPQEVQSSLGMLNSVPSHSNPRLVQTTQGPALLLTCPPRHESPSSATDAATPLKKYTRWTPDEDALLKTAIELERTICPRESRINWKKISRVHFLGKRNDFQCKSRWLKVRYMLTFFANEIPSRCSNRLRDIF